MQFRRIVYNLSAMTLHMWLTLAILAVAIFLFVTEWLRVDVVAMGAVIALALTGILTPEEALSGFSSTAVITITALFVVGGMVLHTGLAGTIGRAIIRVAGDDPNRLLLLTVLGAALLSSFISDTGTVAVLLPAVISLAEATRLPPSRLLIPLAYGSLLGGAATLIGTAPNIIASDLLRSAGFTAFQFFDFTPLGLLLIFGGALILWLGNRWLLPSRQSDRTAQPILPPAELLDHYRLPDNLFRLRVRRRSALVGHTLASADLRNRFEVTVMEIARPRQAMSGGGDDDSSFPARFNPRNVQIIHPGPDATLQADDILIARGLPEHINQAATHWNLGLQPAAAADNELLISHEVGIAELVIPPRSTLIGHTLTSLNFARIYRLTVLNIHRADSPTPLNLKTTPLRLGDVLLVQGEWQNILALRDNRRDFVLIGETALAAPARRRKAPIALAILAIMLVLIITNAIPLVVASLLAALAAVLTGCLTMDDAYDAVSWKSIVLIAGMWPVAIALEKVGLVAVAADTLALTLGNFGPLVVLAGLFITTAVFTQVLSNTATALLIGPIALSTATAIGVQPQALLMAVAVAASIAFASPVASPVNTLVMGAGNYRFADFLRAGLPLMLFSLIAALLVLPLLFPF